ncbi:cytochrome P450 [Polaromonas sp. C04]|uniref:cytochrome P450 n=1 Tax=Polaromonas sp. C04 TaxID=1945857 RepID=UPI000987482F|nr:cytochrome P450 [Polaromonas sp. C04]OOG58992.1 cytochrome [Polaromonas sp. C04]
MNDKRKPDWDPRSEEVVRDQRAAYDEMRERCPVAYSEFMQWSLFRHEDVSRVLHDHKTFSNAVSRHLSVPNGMDPPEHTKYRRIIESYFTVQRMDAFEPVCRQLVAELVRDVLASGEVELMADFALPFAVRVQCAFLGWPPTLRERLVRWTRKNYEATLAQDLQAMSEIAREFEGFIDGMLETRMQTGAKPEDDVMGALTHEKVWGRPLSNEEIASILRNWTVGEIGTISASVGILIHHLSQHVELQQRLRAQPLLLPAAIDEILRIHGPLVANRRVTTRKVAIGGQKIGAGERISLNWVSANRDGRVFEDPQAFRLDRDPAANLLYGAGVHVCPGAPLARMEMRVCLEQLLERTTRIQDVPGKAPRLAVYPASGFATLPLQVR